MLGGLVKAVVIIAVLAGGATYLMGWWSPTQLRPGDQPVGTTGVNTERARQVGAQIGERAATAADQARRGLSDAGITTKIKAKMALDDTVKALDVNVDTSGTRVTVSGTVTTPAQKARVLQLAKETDGVTEVVDRVQVRQ